MKPRSAGDFYVRRQSETQLLIERWHPVTKDMGLINAPVERVVSELVKWHASVGVKYSRKEITSSFADALEALPPLSMEKRPASS